MKYQEIKMGKPKESKSWVERIKEKEPLFDMDTLTLLNTAANGKIKDDKAKKLNEKLLQCFKNNKHDSLTLLIQDYSPDQKLKILTLRNNSLFNLVACDGNLNALKFFQNHLGNDKLIELSNEGNLRTINNLLTGEWSRANQKERASSKNCVDCFKFFLNFVEAKGIQDKINTSGVIFLKSIEEDFHTAVRQMEKEGPDTKKARESPSCCSSPIL